MLNPKIDDAYAHPSLKSLGIPMQKGDEDE